MTAMESMASTGEKVRKQAETGAIHWTDAFLSLSSHLLALSSNSAALVSFASSSLSLASDCEYKFL